jgi:hypothetical protein
MLHAALSLILYLCFLSLWMGTRAHQKLILPAAKAAPLLYQTAPPARRVILFLSPCGMAKNVPPLSIITWSAHMGKKQRKRCTHEI